jgi:CRP/FNR family transcriptional regulator, cyclic AMP receptor protein
MAERVVLSSATGTIPDVTDVALLREVELFRDLSPDAFTRMEPEVRTRVLQRGDVLFREGDESMIALMERGDLLGDMPLFDGLTRSAEARALEASEVLVVPYAPLRAALEDDPSLLWAAVELLALRLRSVDMALADSVFLDVTGRTAKRLLELAGESDEFQLPITQEELAGMVGASRERVNKAIASFIRLGWIAQQDRRYRITDREQLTRRAR